MKGKVAYIQFEIYRFMRASPTIGIGRFANTTFFLTIATISKDTSVPCTSICSSSDDDGAGTFGWGSEVEDDRARTANGLGSDTILPSSRWWPIRNDGRAYGRNR
jgi:hypothetical protein